MTFVSLTTSASPRRRKSGSSRTREFDEPAVGPDDQHARAVPRVGGSKRDAFGRKNEIERVDAHGIPVPAPASREQAAGEAGRTSAFAPALGKRQLSVALTILSGSRTGSPRLILSTFSIPETTLPQTVYCRSRKGASPKQMKNCELAEFRTRRARHRHRPAHVRLGVELGLEVGYFDPPVPVSVRAAGLGHEAVDHPVKDDAVIETLGHEALDVGDMARRERRVHFDHHRAFARLEGQRVACVRPYRRSSSFGRGGHPHGHDLVGVRDRAIVGLSSGLDLVDDVHSRDHLAESRILAVEGTRVGRRDEKLRIG